MRWKRSLLLLIFLFLCLPVGAAFAQEGGSKETEWEKLNQEVLRLHKAGEYERAIPVAEKALEDAEKFFGPADTRVSTSLNNLASLYETQGRYTEAESLYKKALALTQQALGADHVEVGISLGNLANLYSSLGRFADAEPILKRALSILERGLGPEDPAVAVAANNLALLYKKQGRYPEAEAYYTKAMAILEKSFGPDHQNVAAIAQNLANLYAEQGKYKEARLLTERALSIKEKLLGPEHPDLAVSLNTLAQLYLDGGKYEEADSLYRKALAILEKALGSHHPDVAALLNNLADISRLQGKFGEAESLYARSLAIDEKALGSHHPDVANSLRNLGTLYKYQGKYAEAEFHFKKALAIQEKALGLEHPDLAISLNNLAELYRATGRYPEAEALYRRALSIYEKALGAGHSDVARSLNNLALILALQEKPAESEALYKEALAIYEKALGGDHPEIATTLANLAALYASQKRYQEAETLDRKALSMKEKLLGPEDPDLALSLNNLALLYSFQGKHLEAGPLYTRALAIIEKRLGSEHPYRSVTMMNLAFHDLVTGHSQAALPLIQKALSIDEKIIENVFSLASEQEKLRFLGTVRDNYWLLLNLVRTEYRDSPDALSLAFNAVLGRKGVVLDALSKEREALIRAESPHFREVHATLQQVSSSLASLALTGPGRRSQEEYLQSLHSLEKQKEELEKELAQMSTLYLSHQEWERGDLKRIRKLLPPDSVLIEFASVPELSLAADGSERSWKGDRYLAFLLPSGEGKDPPLLIDLGEASVTENAIREFRKEMTRSPADLAIHEQTAERRLAQKGERLYTLLMAPLSAVIGKSRTLFLAPDAELNLLPFEALQDREGHYLVEQYQVHYLSSGRDLLRFREKPAPGKDTLIVADPDYNLSAASGKGEGAAPGNWAKTYMSAQRSGITLPGTVEWPPLPGTRKEAEEVKEILSAETPRAFLGKEAREDLIKGVKSPRLLHIATHGFFLEEEGSSQQSGARGRGVFQLPSPDSSLRVENPLLRSGLVLAGANRLGKEDLPEGSDDGILTALEVSGMQLRGTDLVVLSACETGLGETRRGEGVFGLRRAFQMAGARTIVMSLWSVSDQETQKLMSSFYGRIKEGEGKAKALREAKLAMIKERRVQHGAAHPFFWGAFICVGEP